MNTTTATKESKPPSRRIYTPEEVTPASMERALRNLTRILLDIARAKCQQEAARDQAS